MKQQRQQIEGKTTEKVKFELDEVPALKFREASFSESWSLVSVDFVILFLLIVCFFMIAYVGFVRSDVR